MKISNSKKQLAKIIHENGGWRDGAGFAAQDRNASVTFFVDAPWRCETSWEASEFEALSGFGVIAKSLPNWHQTILSRDEYFHLYPAPVEVVVENKTTCHLTVTDKPTIEQLASDYRNRKDYADRKQQEADAAKADAEAKLAELVAAGKALGLVVSVAEVGSQIRLFRNAKLGPNPNYSDAVRHELCEVCGHRFGLHCGGANTCPTEE